MAMKSEQITGLIRCNRIKYQGQNSLKSFDWVIDEQPLKLELAYSTNAINPSAHKLHHATFSITMRTPGDDRALVLGMLFCENLIQTALDVSQVTLGSGGEEDEPNLARVTLASHIVISARKFQRTLPSYSSCGLCGNTQIQALEQANLPPLNDDAGWLALDTIYQLAASLNQSQVRFAQTGGVHGCGLFDAQGKLLFHAEDIGRHNAVDKVAGMALVDTDRAKLAKIMVVSSRVSFEIVQKALILNKCAPISILVALGAPSSMAIKTAQRFNLTLIGFCSESSFNVYHGHFRLVSDTAARS